MRRPPWNASAARAIGLAKGVASKYLTLRRLSEQQQRDVLIADAQHSKLDLYIRSLIAFGPATYILKIFLWDKVLAAWTNGTTDKIDPNLWQVVMVILGFYFVSATTTTVARIFASRK